MTAYFSVPGNGGPVLWEEAEPPLYVFRWGRPYFDGARKGHRCLVLWRGKRNSALVRWESGGTDLVSRNALRKAPA